MRRRHRDASCAINTLLIAHRHDAPRALFDHRAAHCQRLCDQAAEARTILAQLTGKTHVDTTDPSVS